MAGTVESYPTEQGRRWMVRYRKPDKTQTKKRGFATKREATDFLATVTVSKATGEYIDPALSRTTVGALGAEWLRLKRGLKPSYVKTLERDWRVYVEPRWGHVEVGKILPSDVAGWVQDLSDGSAPTARATNTRNPDGPRSASVVLRCLGILRGILDVAVDDRRIKRNPAAGVKQQPRKHSKKERRYLTDDEVGQLAAAVADPVKSTLVLFLAYTGLRWGEAVALRARDLNSLRRRVHVRRSAVEVEGEVVEGAPKSWEDRVVPVPSWLVRPLEVLIADRGPDALIFPGALGGFMPRPTTAEDSTSWYRMAIRRAGIERLTLHDLRHTAASLAIASGANPKVVQRMLGHKSAAMTLDTYADLFDSDLDDVADRMGARGAESAARALASVGIA